MQLQPGDLVVHEQHGVGRFIEMVQRTVAGATREYLVIEYAASKRGQPGDRLYAPTDALDQVTRYVGGENPTLDRMGGADWAKRKGARAQGSQGNRGRADPSLQRAHRGARLRVRS